MPPMDVETPAATVPARRRLAADDRREAILRSARKVFARNGFRGASTAAIAAGAGCSEPMLYKLYASKQALFAAVLRHATEEMSCTMMELLDGSEDTVDALAMTAHRVCSDGLVVEIIRLRMLAMSLSDEPEIRAALVESVDRMRTGWGQRVAAAQRAGTVRSDVDADAVVWLWTGFTLMAGYRHALEGDAALADAQRLADTFLQLIRTPRQEGEVA